MKLYLILIFVNFVSIKVVFAAACCGGGSAIPSLITTDDRSQFSSSLSVGEVVVDSVDGAGIWFKNLQHLQTRTMKFDYAYVLDNDIQFGVTIPFVTKTIRDQTFSGLSDVQANLGYEYLPELDYNLYKPRAFVYSGIIFPTGQSKYTSSHAGLDSRGRQLWGVTVGHVLSKIVGRYDFLQMIDLHHYFDQTLKSNQQANYQIKHEFGGQVNFGVGYSRLSHRLGLQLAWFYEGRFVVKNQSISDQGYIEKYGQFLVSYSYMLSDLSSMALSYADQTLIGEPQNTSLSRSLALQYTQRWTR